MKAETNNVTFNVGYFKSRENAIIAMNNDKESENGIYCLSGVVDYVFDEEIIG